MKQLLGILVLLGFLVRVVPGTVTSCTEGDRGRVWLTVRGDNRWTYHWVEQEPGHNCKYFGKRVAVKLIINGPVAVWPLGASR